MPTIPTCTNIANANISNTNWSPTLGIRTSVQNTDNPNYPRLLLLDQNYVTVQRPGLIFGMTNEAIIALAILSVPGLSWPPIITVQPTNVTTNGDNGASFNVTATAELAITYQWQISTNLGVSYSNLTNTGVYSTVTTNEMNISVCNGLGTNVYRCAVTNASGTTYTNGASLIVDPYITTQPVSHSVAAPAATTFSIIASGNTSLTYQWQLSSDGGSTWGNLSNSGVYSTVTTTTLHISDSTGLNAKKYRCLVNDMEGQSTSNSATLTVT